MSALAIAAVVGALALSVRAQTSNVTCTYAEWTYNTDNETACRVWAELQDICSPGVSVGPITSTTAPYTPPTGSTANDCNCNVVAYNLMGGCSWCQPNIYSSDWVSYSSWKAGCSSFNEEGLNADILAQAQANDINIPTWAFLPISGSTWAVTPAENWAENSASITPGGGSGGSSTPPAGGGSSTPDDPPPSSSSSRPANTGGGGYTSSPRPSSGGIGGGFDDDLNNATDTVIVAVGVAVGICVGIPLICSIIALIVYCKRQNNRKAFYGPLASYYAGGGAPPPTAYNGAPVYSDKMAAPPVQMNPGYAHSPQSAYVQPGSPDNGYAGIVPGSPPPPPFASPPFASQYPAYAAQQSPYQAPQSPYQATYTSTPPPQTPVGGFIQQPPPKGVPLV